MIVLKRWISFIWHFPNVLCCILSNVLLPKKRQENACNISKFNHLPFYRCATVSFFFLFFVQHLQTDHITGMCPCPFDLLVMCVYCVVHFFLLIIFIHIFQCNFSFFIRFYHPFQITLTGRLWKI